MQTPHKHRTTLHSSCLGYPNSVSAVLCSVCEVLMITPHSCNPLYYSLLWRFSAVCGRKRKLCYFLRETDGLFESPDILDGVHVLLLYLLLDIIRQVTEEVNARVVFQGLDVDHVVA